MTTPFDRVRARHGTSEASHPYCEECAKPYPCDTALVLDELTLLKRIARDLHWMARRYADGRSTYATSLFNAHTRALLGMGVEPNISGDGTPWARDAMGRAYDGLTEEEASKGTPLYDWQTRVVPEEMAWLRAELAALRAQIARDALALAAADNVQEVFEGLAHRPMGMIELIGACGVLCNALDARRAASGTTGEGGDAHPAHH